VPYCYFQAPRRGRDAALMEFAEAVRESSLPAADAFSGVAFSSWLAVLRAAVQGATREHPAIVVIDELPYLAELDEGFAADLQKAWDRALNKLPVLLICVGSDVRMMDELVRARAPLHGRPTRELRVLGLDPAAVATITGTRDPADALDRYLVIGGLPSLARRVIGTGGLQRKDLTVLLHDSSCRHMSIDV